MSIEQLLPLSLSFSLTHPSPCFFCLHPSCLHQSEWGHDFRPDYISLKELKSEFPLTPIMALTATANKTVADDCESSRKAGRSTTALHLTSLIV